MRAEKHRLYTAEPIGINVSNVGVRQLLNQPLRGNDSWNYLYKKLQLLLEMYFLDGAERQSILKYAGLIIIAIIISFSFLSTVIKVFNIHAFSTYLWRLQNSCGSSYN